MTVCSSEYYWVFLKPYVKVFRNNDRALLYNTSNGDRLIVERPDQLNGIDELNRDRSRPVLKESGELNVSDTDSLIEELKSRGMLEVLQVAENRSPLIIGAPIEKGRVGHDGELIASGLLNHLKKLNINIYSEAGVFPQSFREAGKQFPFFEHTEHGVAEIETSLLEKIFCELKGRGVSELSVFTTSLGRHRDFDIITEMAGDYSEDIVFNIPATDLSRQLESIGKINIYSNISVKIHFASSIPETELDAALKGLRLSWIPFEFNFIVKGEEDLDYYSDLIEEFSPESYWMQPFFDGGNLGFFKDNVVVKSAGFERIRSSEDIFTNSIFNTENYGSLTVSTDGRVYGSMNKSSIGELTHSSLFEIIYKELREGNSWGDVRTKLEFCKDCVYNRICPPIKGYEHVIGTEHVCMLNDNPESS